MSSPPDSFHNSLGSHEPSPELDSPFLNEEYLAEEARTAATRRIPVPGFQLESPFLGAFEEELWFEQEILGEDTRGLIKNTLEVPYRWICAIDILSDKPGLHSRATGILIGPRYILTAKHIWTDEARDKGLTVSPARNGSNSNNPFGKVKAKKFRFPTPYYINLPVQHGKSAGTQTTISQNDDYMLIILKQDLDSMTHPKMRGALGYWGQNPAEAVVRLLEPQAIQGKEIVVIGYPGDTCGTDKFSGSDSQKLRAMNNCIRTQKNEWASRQWRGTGILDARTNIPSRIYHTADTYKGQSGSPICLTTGQTLNLVGIHVDEESAQRNLGLRVTERMLHNLCAWMNADAGYPIASIKDNALIVQPKSNGAKEFFDGFAREVEDFSITSEWTSSSEEEAEYDQIGEFETFDYLEPEAFDEGYSLDEWMPSVDREVLYEFDTSSTPSQAIVDALSKKDWELALKLAIQEGWRNENQLVNLLFFARHPELPKEKLDPNNPKFKQLSAEWTEILNKEVMHLSDWVFGIPIPSAAAQPELEAFEDFNHAEFDDDEFEDEAEAFYNDVEYERADHVGHLDYETEDEEANDDIAKVANEDFLEYETQEEFLKRLRDVAESQSGVRLSYRDYPVTKKDLKGRSGKNNPWRQTTTRQRFKQLEADGSFCLGASRSMAFRTLFGLDKPSYRQVLTSLNKQIEAARKSKDEDTEARLIISRIVSHSHDPGSMTQFNQDIGMRYGIKNAMVRNASRAEALSALKQGAAVIADLRGGWHWVLVQQSPRGRLMANDPLYGADVRAIKKEDLGERFELIVNATTHDVITPNKANDHKNHSD